MDQSMNAYHHYARQAAGSMSQGHCPGMGQTMGATMHGQGQYPQGTAYPGYGMYVPHPSQQGGSLHGFANDRFLKGLLIGAAAAYLLTNENVQRTAIKGAVKAWSLLQGGVEELKERFHDAEAELRAESAE